MIQFCFSLGLQGVDLCGFLAHKKPVLPPPPQKKNLARRCVFRVFRNIFSTKTKVKWHTLHFTLKKQTRKTPKTPRVPKQKKNDGFNTFSPKPKPRVFAFPIQEGHLKNQSNHRTDGSGWFEPPENTWLLSIAMRGKLWTEHLEGDKAWVLQSLL